MFYNAVFWGVPIAALVTYLVLLFFFAISKKDRAIKSFQPILLALLLWTASSLLMKLDATPGALFWNHIMLLGVIFSPFLIYVFLSVFTNTIRFGRIVGLGIFTMIMAVIDLLGLVVTKATVLHVVDPHGVSQVEFAYELGSWAVPVYIGMFLILIAIFFKVFTCLRVHKYDIKQIRPLLIGAIIVFIGLLCNLSPELGKYPIDILAGIINGGCIMKSIYGNRLLEMKFMITRGLVFSFFTLILMGAYLFIVINIDRAVFLNGVPAKYMTIATAFVIALLFQPIFNLAKKLSDHLFYKSEYNQRNALKDFSINLANNLSLTEISFKLMEAIGLAMGPKRTCLLLRDKDTGNYSTFKSMLKLNPMEFSMNQENPVVVWLKEHNSCLTRDNINSFVQFKSLWDEEMTVLSTLDAEVFVPMKSRDELIGIILLTSKRNNIAYTLDDLDVLKSFGASSAMAISNALLYTKATIDATTDDMTKAYNRRYLLKYLEEQVEICHNKSLSVLVMDLDRFKLYNELYGYLEGDKAINKVADIILDIVDGRGIVARYSGGQFVAVLPYHDSAQARAIAEIIRKKTESVFLDKTSTAKQFLTMSIGVCTYPVSAPNFDELMTRANLALFNAKENGKNNTVIYSAVSCNNTLENNNSDEKHKLRATVYALTAAIDAKDHYTFTHSSNVAKYASTLGRALGLDETHLDLIYEAGFLHDVGKIGIPENILTKKTKLTAEEYEIIKQHVDISINIVQHLPSMAHVIPAIISHHERWDGTGYPRQLKGEEIPIEARCLNIADTFDAITSSRPYKQGLSVEFALDEIEKMSGLQFDPVVAKVFVSLVREGKMDVTPTTDIS